MPKNMVLSNWRVWAPLLVIWTAITALALALGGSGAGQGSLVGGPAGALGAHLVFRVMRNRGRIDGTSD